MFIYWGKKILARTLQYIGDFGPDSDFYIEREKIKDFVRYSHSPEDGVIYMKDHSVMAVYRLSGLEHEFVENMIYKTAPIVRYVETLIDPETIVQFFYVRRNTDKFPEPDFYRSDSKTYPQVMFSDRVDYVKSAVNDSDFPLVKFEVFMVVRQSGDKAVASVSEFGSIKLLAEEVESLCKKFQRNLKTSEVALENTDLNFTRLNTSEIMAFINYFTSQTYDMERCIDSSDLNDSISTDSITLPSSPQRNIEIGSQKIDVLCSLGFPGSNYDGMFAKLLTVNQQFTFVLNICHQDNSDLSWKRTIMAGNVSTQGRLPIEELDTFETQIQIGDMPVGVSFAAYVTCDSYGDGEDFKKAMKSHFGWNWHIERFQKAGVWLENLPGHYSQQSDSFLKRKKRCVSSDLRGFLPIYKSFQGTGKNYGQLLRNRSGEAIYCSSKHHSDSSNLALLGGTGAGKSVNQNNSILSNLAFRPDYMVFIIDFSTSYEYLAKVVDEHSPYGCKIYKPPQDPINPFIGEFDKERFDFVSSLICSAASMLAEKKFSSDAQELVLEALRQAYRENCDHNRKWLSTGRTKLKAMTITDVIANLAYAQDLLATNEDVNALERTLNPLRGTGRLSHLFDTEHYYEVEEGPAHSIQIWDLELLKSNKLDQVVTSQIIISEVFRQRKRPVNLQRAAELTAEEIGILSAKSDDVSDFFVTAWKMLRKQGFQCSGLTNECLDYLLTRAGKAVWSQSPTKIYLKMQDTEARKVIEGDPAEGTQPLVEAPRMKDILLSLQKKKYSFADQIWSSNEYTGTATYYPSATDLWLAVNNPIDKENVEKVARVCEEKHEGFGYSAAIQYLAQNYPRQVKNKYGEPRLLSKRELESIDLSEDRRDYLHMRNNWHRT